MARHTTARRRHPGRDQPSITIRGALQNGPVAFRRVTGLLTISEVSRQTTVAPSALRFYEERGLISSVRAQPTARRHYHRDVLARIEFIQRAQLVGLSLGEIGDCLALLPRSTPAAESDWTAVARAVTPRLDRQAAVIEELRAQLRNDWMSRCLATRS